MGLRCKSASIRKFRCADKENKAIKVSAFSLLFSVLSRPIGLIIRDLTNEKFRTGYESQCRK